MKKWTVWFMGVFFIGVFAVPVMAVDHEFGGFWRTRFYNNTDFSGTDDGSRDVQKVDTRTHLYYTAIFHDDLKLVNKFEMDAEWGDEERGDIGADGSNIKIKNSYADFTLGDFNFKLGTQGKVLARGFLFDDDFSGAIVRYVGDDMVLPFVWMKAYEGGTGKDANDMDFDYYGLDPVFSTGDFQLNPFALYMTSNGGGDLNDDNEWTGWENVTGLDAVSIYYLGLNVDYITDFVSAWLTAVYSGGTVDVSNAGNTAYPEYYIDTLGTDSFDVNSYLFAVGGSVNLDLMSIHGQFFYASGDDNGVEDDEASDFFVPAGQSYYWAEIMGFGTFDDQVSAGSLGDRISNIMAANVGVDFFVNRMTLSLDLWHASLVEDNAEGENQLGTEIDLAMVYPLMDELSLKVVAAYLFAGKATGGGDENPMEFGTMLSLNF